MTTERESLRQEFLSFESDKDFLPGYQKSNALFDWFYSKLEAKDKEIDFQKRGFDFLYGQAKQEITDLKAEIERLHKSISRI